MSLAGQLAPAQGLLQSCVPALRLLRTNLLHSVCFHPALPFVIVRTAVIHPAIGDGNPHDTFLQFSPISSS